MRGLLILAAGLLFAGCFDLGRVNPHFFPKEGKRLEVSCGKNFDLCEEKASYHCGFRGYKILSKKKTDSGYTASIQCNR